MQPRCQLREGAPRELRAEQRLCTGAVSPQAALTHLGFWLKLHLHLLPARGEKHRERGQSSCILGEQPPNSASAWSLTY